MSSKGQVVEQAAQPILAIRTRAAVGDLPNVLGPAYQSLVEYLTEMGTYPAGPPFVAYYNMDMADLDIAIGFPVAKELPGKDNMKPGEIPAGKYATCMHIGPYNKIENAYNSLTEFIKEQDFTPSGVAYEFYLNDPRTIPEEELQTKVMLALV